MELKLINLIYQITRAEFGVKFNEDMDGMLRIDYSMEFDSTFYEHEHIGYPDQPREKLQESVIKSLEKFITKHAIPSKP
jgi:hypothetical protein